MWRRYATFLMELRDAPLRRRTGRKKHEITGSDPALRSLAMTDKGFTGNHNETLIFVVMPIENARMHSHTIA